MRAVTPQAYLFMSSRLEGEANSFFQDIGIPDWLHDKRKETYSDGDIGIESAGRLCYRSWIPHDPYRPDASNPNVDRIREGNVPYVGNIIKQKHGCYDIETEVLTADGWKSWPDVAPGDLLATRAQNGTLEYHKPIRLISYEYSGKMYRVESQGVDLLVTPDHNMLACPTTTVQGRRKADFRLIKASELDTKSHAYIKSAEWTGGRSVYRVGPDQSPVSPAVMALLGFAIGDGHLGREGRRLTFHLRRPRKIQWLRSIATQIGWGELGINSDNYDYSITVPKEYIDLFRSIYSDDREKQIPPSLLMSCNKDDLNYLFNGLMQADEHESKNGDLFDTTSSRLSGQFQQLCLHVGLAANIEHVLSERGRSFGDKPLTRFGIIRRNIKPEVNRFSGSVGKTSWVDGWSGTVFCAEVPNNTLYVRRNGIPVWSGNSVFEHVNVTFIFHNVSRCFTHELVRHRAGCAYSQESLRFVRLDALKFWVPGEARALGPEVVDFLIRGILTLETLQAEFIHLVGLDSEKDFKRKKILTSLARRLAPIGLATSIMATLNLRAWRHVISQRSDPAAEEEMRLLIGGTVAPKLKLMYPAAFQDMHQSASDEFSWTFESPKI